LAAASEDEILKLWEGLGYYTRARNLHRAAKMIVEQYDGKLPRNAELLQLLPGVGRYTAAAIASIAFGERVAVVDGNVKRVLSRLYNLDACIDEPETERELWSIAESLVPQREPGDFNQAMMELGARLCLPKKPVCGDCPVADDCQARAAGAQEERPVRKARKAVPFQEMVVAVLEQEGRYLIGKRPGQGLLGGLWEFPCDVIAAGETHQKALVRVCKESLGLKVKAGGLIATVQHAYTHLRVTMNVYRCTLISGTPKPRRHAQLAWAASSEFEQYAFPKANHKFLPLLSGQSDMLF